MPNYATEYSAALDQQFPHVLHFGALYSTANNGRYRWINSKTIEIPNVTTTGRKDGNRAAINAAARNWDNTFQPYALTQHRYWDTLIHPMDIDQTNQVASIANITQVYNQEQKFPEMDAYTVSKMYADFTEAGLAADTTTLTAANILTTIDTWMEEMDEKNVPRQGRILYLTPAANTLLKNATQLVRAIDPSKRSDNINRAIASIDDLTIEPSVPSDLMKTAYDFTDGWAVGSTAKQINMMMVHPLAVITPHKYDFASLDAPTALTQGKWYYYEESFEDVFVLKHKMDALKFNIGA